MNSVLLTGYISKESQVFNKKVMKFTIATSSNVKVNDQWESKASFHQITAFGYHIKRSVSKGDLVSVECHLDYSNYEKDGQKVYQTSLILDNLEVLKRKESQQSAPANSYQGHREQEKKDAFEQQKQDTGRTHEQQKQDYVDGEFQDLPF